MIDTTNIVFAYGILTGLILIIVLLLYIAWQRDNQKLHKSKHGAK